MSNSRHDRHPRAVELIATLQMQPHPEGGWYAEVFRSPHMVQTHDGRPPRAALTSIDFLLEAGQASAWHRVRSDEVWHLLEGTALLLWLLPPQGGPLQCVRLAADGLRRHVVPADWWQAAEPGHELASDLASGPASAPAGLGFAYVGATVGPGFDFADFSFGRDDEHFKAALQQYAPQTLRLL